MRVPLIQGVSSGSVNSTSITLATPTRLDGAALQPGDLLFAILGRGGLAYVDNPDWENHYAHLFDPATGPKIRIELLYREVSSAEPSSHAFQVGAIGVLNAIMFGVSRTQLANLFDGTLQWTNHASLDNFTTAPAVTTARRNSLVIDVAHHSLGNLTSTSTLTAPTGMTKIASKNSGGVATTKQVTGVYYKLMQAPGSSGVMTDTCSNNSDSRSAIAFGVAGDDVDLVDVVGR